jgi:hypothetical protein
VHALQDVPGCAHADGVRSRRMREDALHMEQGYSHDDGSMFGIQQDSNQQHHINGVCDADRANARCSAVSCMRFGHAFLYLYWAVCHKDQRACECTYTFVHSPSLICSLTLHMCNNLCLSQSPRTWEVGAGNAA